MSCQHPKQCKTATEERYARMEPFLEEANKRLERFRRAYDQGKAELAFDGHAEFREVFRAFSQSQVMEAFMEGDVIECHKKNGEYGFLIWYYVKIGRGQYRPIHVRAIMPVQNQHHMMVVTVYDPRSMDWRWNNTFDKRICLCDGKI
jgi:hypothetical protein